MRFTHKILPIAALGLAACAGMQKPPPPQTPAPVTAVPAGPPQRLIVFIPHTDQAAHTWFKFFERHPNLRMTLAVSPRFQRFLKEPAMKEQALELVKAGRLELALQLPNAPFLPLLINTDAARAALPPGTPVPAPPFVRPEDATQIVAKAKANFARTWGMAPKGLVLPLGAANADTLRLVNRLGFDWVIGALGAPPNAGAYRFHGLSVWDATPMQEPPNFSVQVLDERMTGNPAQSLQVLNTWSQELGKKNLQPVLPSEPGLPIQELPENGTWGNRTWTTKDWSPWIGSPQKNAAWSWLRTTREALDRFKNSGQASVRRLDMAYEEVYNAENANYFSGITEGESTFSLAEEREREFKATLSSVFRLIGQAPPDNLFSADRLTHIPGFKASSTTVVWEPRPEGGRLTIEDVPNDANGDGQLATPPGIVPGAIDLLKLEVNVSRDHLEWTLTLGELDRSQLGNFESPGPLIDLYLDLNGQPNVGTVSLLPGRGAAAAPESAWEYAFVLWGTRAQFYRTRGPETYELSETLPLQIESNRIRFTIPRTWLRGNPQRWAYQALVMVYDPKSLDNEARPLVSPEMAATRRLPIYDLIDPLDVAQSELLTQLEQGRLDSISFVQIQTR